MVCIIIIIIIFLLVDNRCLDIAQTECTVSDCDESGDDQDQWFWTQAAAATCDVESNDKRVICSQFEIEKKRKIAICRKKLRSNRSL